MRPCALHRAVAIGICLVITSCEHESGTNEITGSPPPEVAQSAVSAAAAQTLHFKSRGSLAQVSFFMDAPGGVVFGFVEATRGGTKANPQTLLFYTVERCDAVSGECTVLEQGSGLIPNGDLVVRNRETTLNTNTSAASNPHFERFLGSGGRITVHWTRTSAVVTDFHGHSRTRIEGLIMERSQFASSTSSAFARGTIFGTAVDLDNASGVIGTIRSGTLAILKGM